MRLTLAFVLILLLVSSARSQTFDLDLQRLPVAELKGQFRFHTGDDLDGKLGWADPRFDDSTWPLLASDQTWYSQGYKDYGGPAWYRFRVTVPPGQQNLAIFFPGVQDSFQVFVNGSLVGHAGNLPPNESVVLHRLDIFYIPPQVLSPGEPLVFAIRCWRSPMFAAFSGAGLNAAPVVGDAAVLTRLRDLEIHDMFWANQSNELLLLANILAAVLGFALFALRPTEREYFWFGAAQVLWSLNSVINAAGLFLHVPLITQQILAALGFFGGAFLNIEFFHALLHERRRALYWIAAIPVLIPIPLIAALMAGWIPIPVYGSVYSLAFLPYSVVVVILLFCAARRGNLEARILCVPFSVSCISIFVMGSLPAVDPSRHPLFAAAVARYNMLLAWPIHLDAGNLIGLACITSVCVVLVLRFARSRRDEERLSAELEAARVVQHVLIPDEVPAVPGFNIESVYKPAGQVGGDFFQIIPRAEGGALIAIGDVSGKGMPAAMTVSLLVGTFRTLAHYTHSPAEILAAMNQRMLARSQGGFTTCLVVRLDPDGTLTAANAGHIAPYIGGRELEVANGLPLGLSAASEYRETTTRLDASDRLTLLTDGVIEARNPQGELLGFDRARELTMRPAPEIVRSAQHFGQEDDITVLTLSLAPAAVSV